MCTRIAASSTTTTTAIDSTTTMHVFSLYCVSIRDSDVLSVQPNHSEHWNQHHGRISDKHNNHHSRSLLNIQALNLGSLNRNSKLQKCSGSHYHCANGGQDLHHKRALDKVTAPVKQLLDGGKSKAKSKGKGASKTKSSASSPRAGSGKHSHGLMRSFRSTGRKHRSDKKGKGKRQLDEEEGEEHPSLLQARDHRDNRYQHDGIDRHPRRNDHSHYHGHARVHEHSHDRRQLAPAGVPGFVQVASTLSHSNLAKSVAGLVFSKDPDSNSSDFVLGTSDSQSTQFYLAPYTDPLIAGSAPLSNFAVNTSASGQDVSDPEATIATYQLRIPILDSSSQQVNDYCATFDVKPPSPLSMQPCGQIDGSSQIFGYNATTGELAPIYPPTESQPKPLNAAVKIGDPQILAAQAAQPTGSGSGAFGPATASGSGAGSDAVSAWNNAAAATDSDAAATTNPSPTTSSAAFPAALPSDAPTPPKVSLYFIPSSAYYSDPDSIDSLSSAANSTISEASEPAEASFTAAPAAIKAAISDEGAYGDDEEAIYTTVTVTTTVSAEPAGPTGDNYQTFDNSQQGRNNAVIADQPEDAADADGSSFAADNPSAAGTDGTETDGAF